MPASYFPLDVNFFDHPKVVPLGDTTLRMHLSAIGYANRLMTDGFIARPIPGRLVEWDWTDTDAPTPRTCIAELVAVMLWHPAGEPCPRGHDETCPKADGNGWRIHDFLEHNRSREQRLASQEAERDRKAAYRQRQRDAAVPRDTTVTGDAGRGHTGDVTGTGNTETETETETGSTTVVERARPLSVIPGGFSDDPADILDVWDTWKTSTGKQRCDFSPVRRQAIAKALDKYPLQDVLDAVQGHIYDPWPERPQHTDITQLLHMGTKRKPHNTLEKMRDLWRNGPPRQISNTTAKAMRTSADVHRWAEEVNGERTRVGGPGGRDQRGLPAPAGRPADSG